MFVYRNRKSPAKLGTFSWIIASETFPVLKLYAKQMLLHFQFQPVNLSVGQNQRYTSHSHPVCGGSENDDAFFSVQASGVASPESWRCKKVLGRQNVWLWASDSIFVWATASQSTKWLDMLKISGSHSPLSPNLMGVRRKFSRGGKVDNLLIFFRLLAMQRKWTYTKKMSNDTATVAYSVFPVRKLYTEQMFVLVSMDTLRLSYQRSKWITIFVSF